MSQFKRFDGVTFQQRLRATFYVCPVALSIAFLAAIYVVIATAFKTNHPYLLEALFACVACVFYISSRSCRIESRCYAENGKDKAKKLDKLSAEGIYD